MALLPLIDRGAGPYRWDAVPQTDPNVWRLRVDLGSSISVGSVTTEATYNAIPPTVADGSTVSLQVDQNGNLKVVQTTLTHVTTTPVFYQVAAGPVLPGFLERAWDKTSNPPTEIVSFRKVLDLSFVAVPGAVIQPPNQEVTGSFTDFSQAVGTASLIVVPANHLRKHLIIQNQGAADIFFNWGAPATTTGDSLRLNANGYYESSGNVLSTQAVHMIAASGSQQVVIKELA